MHLLYFQFCYRSCMHYKWIFPYQLWCKFQFSTSHLLSAVGDWSWTKDRFYILVNTNLLGITVHHNKWMVSTTKSSCYPNCDQLFIKPLLLLNFTYQKHTDKTNICIYCKPFYVINYALITEKVSHVKQSSWTANKDINQFS